MNIKIRYMVKKRDNYYWQPDKNLRQKGYKSIGLGKDFALAQKHAQKLNAELDQVRSSHPVGSTAKISSASATLDDFWQAYRSIHTFKKLAPRTKRDYEYYYAKKVQPIFGNSHPNTISRADVQMWYTYMLDRAAEKNQTNNMANHAFAVLRLLLSYVHDQGQITTNPAQNQRLRGTKPRAVRFEDAEIYHLIATADRMSMPAIGDAICIAYNTALRQADILEMKWLEFQNGRIYRITNKTGATVNFPATKMLIARLEEARERCNPECPTIVCHENTKNSYGTDNFRHRFAKVRAEAGKGMPNILSKTFADLRDTAVTKLAEAGCTAIEIAAITGHSVFTITRILNHYLVLGPTIADNAISKLENSR